MFHTATRQWLLLVRAWQFSHAFKGHSFQAPLPNPLCESLCSTSQPRAGPTVDAQAHHIPRNVFRNISGDVQVLMDELNSLRMEGLVLQKL